MKKCIAISGNIGIGKTTLAKKLADDLNWQAAKELSRQNPFLENFYKDMKKWAFHSQLYFLSKRLEDYYKILIDKESFILDRTIYEDAEIYARNLYKKGYIDEQEWDIYNNLYQTAIKIMPAPDLFVYLKASKDKIMDRLSKREKWPERNIDEDYVDELNGYYDRWISSVEQAPVLIVSCDDLDLKNSDYDYKKFLDKVKELMK